MTQPRPSSSSVASLSLIRGVGWASVAVFTLAVGVYLSRLALDDRGEPVEEAHAVGVVADPSAPLSGSSLQIAVRRSCDLRVVGDGTVMVDRRVQRGETFAWEGARAWTVEGAPPDAVRIHWNGERVTPLGRQDQPRRLVFVDDAERRR